MSWNAYVGVVEHMHSLGYILQNSIGIFVGNAKAFNTRLCVLAQQFSGVYTGT